MQGAQPRQRSGAGWARGPLRPALGPGEVHVWRAELDQHPAPAGLLSRDERARAAQIIDARRRKRWQASRAALRDVLARYLQLAAAELRFAAGAHGKPRLRLSASHAGRHHASAVPGARLRFNLSHSGPLALIALALDHDVGVDVELCRAPADPAYRALASRLAQVGDTHDGRSPRTPQELLVAWTRHEARAKCLGTGVGRARANADAAVTEAGLQVIKLELGEHAVGALALLAQGCAVRCYRWEAPAVSGRLATLRAQRRAR